ncbi:MAG: DUF5686 family protein [Winogradskyella sp.]|uniref:DUF5686 family protein n=1 Tax=Winogradskyella sp. TaxID=1883156 RepID=UPI00385B779D
MRILLLVLLFFLNLKSFAQSTKKLTLVDATTQKVIPFANVVFNGKAYKGTSTDIDGVFYVAATIKTITISYVGYETKTVNLIDVTDQIITLQQKVSTLEEVVISSSENPAHRIIENVIANRDLNNPKNLGSYTYISYDKIIVDIKDRKPVTNSVDAGQNLFKDAHFFITETVAKHKYLKPRFTEDSVIARRTSGLKNPNFAILANTFQPFSFYSEHIELFATPYLNPISKGSTKKYKFRLKDEYLVGTDTVFVISFEPKANRNFEGLTGLLYINSNQYAVESVDAKTYNSGKIDVTIQQKYKFVNNQYWFPEQLNFEIIVGEGADAFKYVGKSYLSEIKPNTALTKKDFPFVSLTLPESVGGKDSKYWDNYRKEVLNTQELRTYTLIDSIGEDVDFDRFLKFPQKFFEGRFPLKYVDVDLRNVIRFNKHENVRLGAGFLTNDDLLKNVSLGAFAGYGFRDGAWKYGGSLDIDVPGKKDVSFHLNYENSIREVGTYAGNNIRNPFVARNIIASQMDAIEALNVRTDMKLLRNMNWSLGFNTAEVTPLYNYEFINNNSAVRRYTNSEVNFGIGYHVNEKLINSFGATTRLANDTPIFNLVYSRGLEDAFNSDFSYNKLRFTLDHSFISKGLGKTGYRLDLGYIDTALPYGLLFTGEGTLDRQIPFVVPHYFQTVTPYEFLSDRYAHLFISHNFGRLFNNKGSFQPDILWHNNFGIGSLEHPASHQFITFETKEALFLETGLELQNLIKLPFENFGYAGFGLGAFYRYGYHSFENTEDNFAVKFSFGFSFR